MKKKALLLITAITLTCLCGCGSKPMEETYFGGGQLEIENGVMKDEDNIYLYLGGSLKKYNKKINTLSIACDDPGCTHSYSSVTCKANQRYYFFNGDLIKIYNEPTYLEDGTVLHEGGLYLCDGTIEKLVFKNELPEGVDKEKYDNGIGSVIVLDDDYLALFNRVYIYILDSKFNVKYTLFDIGSHGGGVYYANNEIYYIDNLYNLKKLDMENGEPSPVELGGNKLTEGYVVDDVLWFSDKDMTLCSYDFKTEEVKEYAEKAVRLTKVGKYIEYLAYNKGIVSLYDTETDENQSRKDIDINEDELFFLDGNYYRYNNAKGELMQYDENYSSVINSWTLSD